MPPIPLIDLKPGDSGIIKGLEGEPAFQKRLADLGIVPGTTVCLVRKAPFRGPIEIGLRGYRLALREEDARKILVQF